MKIISPDRESGDIELPLNMTRKEGQNYPSQFMKKNLASRAPKKSDDFKQTFAYTSNKSSLDGMQQMLLNQ